MGNKAFKVRYKPTGGEYEAKRYEDMTQEEKDENNYPGCWSDAIFVKFPGGYIYMPDNLLEILEGD